VAEFYGKVCGEQYYRAAVDYIRARIEEPRFFVFSDEPSEAEALLHWLEPKEIMPRGGSDWEDMLRMSSFPSIVICNSSYSWWSAWLNDAGDKLVLAPDQWSIRHSAQDIIPPTWTTLQSLSGH